MEYVEVVSSWMSTNRYGTRAAWLGVGGGYGKLGSRGLILSLKEFVAHQVESLEESEWRAVASTVSFHPFRARTSLDAERLTSLHREFEGEDRELAEAGLDDYAAALSREDSQ